MYLKRRVVLRFLDKQKISEQTDSTHQVGQASEQHRQSPSQLFSIIFSNNLAQAFIAIVIFVAAVLITQYLLASKPQALTRPAQETTYSVTLKPVILKTHQPILIRFGEVVAARLVDLRTLVGGEIIGVNPKLQHGNAVNKGDILVTIDPFLYQGAIVESKANIAEIRAKISESNARIELEKNGVKRAREQLELAQRDLERANRLIKRGSVTEKTVDERRLIVSQRQQAFEQRLNTLAVERAKADQQQAVFTRFEWQLQEAERNLSNTTLKAPFDAIVQTETAEPGRLINVNDPIATLYDREALDIRFTLSNAQYGRLLKTGNLIGRDVTVRWYLGEKPIIYQAHINRIGADIAADKGGVDLYARIDQQALSKAPIRPGAFVEIHMTDTPYEQSVSIPESALYNGNHVYIAKDGRLVQRDIRVAAYDNSNVIIYGAFVNGEQIVTTRIAEAGTGLRIRSITEDLDQKKNKQEKLNNTDTISNKSEDSNAPMHNETRS